jgi:tRNA(Ile)-lysidine synthase
MGRRPSDFKMSQDQSPKQTRFFSGAFARWRTEMRRAGFFSVGERVGVAVSGGMDSVLLLDFMSALGSELGLTLAVVHFNHRLRGAESDADEQFVRSRTRELCLEYLEASADVARVARQRKKNLEAMARELRYRFFFSLVKQGKLDKLATAHTANDQAETVLLRLLRGTGTRGLGGIHAQLEGGVVRPFLGLTRAEVIAEVARRGLAFRTDSSNADTRFRRNRLRRDIMPVLEREFNPRIASALSAFADRARDDEWFLEEQARERARPWVVRDAGVVNIPIRRLDELPPAMARRVVRQMLTELPPDNRRGSIAPNSIDIESVRRLAREGQSGKRLLIGGHLEARRDFEWLKIRRLQAPEGPPTPTRHFAHPVEPPAQVSIPELNLSLYFRITEKVDANLLERSYTGGVWLGAVEPQGPLILRNFRPGDCVYRLGHSRPAKVKEIFQRWRVPLEQRPYWPVLELQGKVIWARGLEMPVEFRAERARGTLLTIEESTVPGWSSGNKH